MNTSYFNDVLARINFLGFWLENLVRRVVCRLEENIKIYIKEIVCVDVSWIALAHNRIQ
jgi:hypothetical protein